MELDNLNCPQFVDFTSNEAFNIHDGADFCFDLGLVGELAELGNFPALKISNEPVKVVAYEQPLVLKDSTNRSAVPKQNLKTESKPVLTNSLPCQTNTTNKKVLQPKLVKQNAKSSLNENKGPKPIHNPRIIHAPPLDLNRTRTYSKNETIILDVPAKNTRQSRSKINSDANPAPTAKKSIISRPSSCDKSRAPLPIYHGIKFVPKNMPLSAKGSIDKFLDKSKYRSNSMNKSCHRNNISSTPKTNQSLNGSNIRSSSGSGLLHTELRAYKRMEYERIKRDKERLASMIKKDLETSRTQIEQEEIKKIRSNSVIRSNPIKLFKPVVVKPSSKPLTNPVSPNFSARSFTQR